MPDGSGPILLRVGPGEAKSSERPWSFHSATSQTGRAPCGHESSLEGVEMSSCKGSYYHTHTPIATWMWCCVIFGCGLLQVSKLWVPAFSLTNDLQASLCSAFPSASFRMDVIAALTSLAHISVMRLLSRLWHLAKTAQNQVRQPLSYGSKHKECVLWAGLPSAEWVMCETAQPWQWAFQESLWPSQTFLSSARCGDDLPVALCSTYLYRCYKNRT